MLTRGLSPCAFAVAQVANTSGLVPTATQTILYNDYGKIESISDNGYGMDFTYAHKGSVPLCFELHHLWQSRSFNDSFLLNYGLQGINALLLRGNFVEKYNYYEDFIDLPNNKWW